MSEYRAAWKAAGHPGDGKVGLRVPIYVNEDAEAAYRNPMESAMNSITRLGERVGSYARAEPRDWGEQSRIILGMDYDDWLRDKVVYGTPEPSPSASPNWKRRWAWTNYYEINYGNLMPDEMQTASTTRSGVRHP